MSLSFQLLACNRSGLPPGNPMDAGTDGTKDAGGPANCPLGSVTFHLEGPAGDGGTYIYASSFGDPGDGVWWYSVATADGTPLSIFLSQATACGACDPKPIPIGFGCAAVPAGGVTAAWSGIQITGSARCTQLESGGQPLSGGCNTTQCMPAGQYVVTMCGSRDGNDCGDRSPDAGATCVSVPFDYPTSAVVVGSLPP